MTTITLVTGNAHKLHEYKALIPARLAVDFAMEPLDLVEIQSLDCHEIVKHKLLEAYAILKSPVIVDDVSAGLETLAGLPGPFIKFFMQKLGNDALFKLAKQEGDSVTVTCITGYYDGTTMLYGEGIMRGHVVPARGENNFGFDCVIVPEGETRTVAEMSYDEKNAISHRSLAIKDLIRQLENQ